MGAVSYTHLDVYKRQATYDLGEGLQGTIGIVGPKRMDYEKVVSTLQTVMGQLDTMFKKEE